VRTFAIFAFMLTLAVLPARSTTTETEDAPWRSGLNEDEQVTAVEAAIDSYQSGFSKGMAVGVVEGHVPMADASRIFDKNRPQFSHAFGYYKAAITDYYTRHPAAA
jgi:hypothetical protein